MVFDEQKDIPNSALFSNLSPNTYFSNCPSHINLASGDHTDFAQEEQLGLQCWTMLLVTCVVAEVSFFI